MTVTWDSLEADLISHLPLLRERYGAQKEWWEGDPIPQHVLMGDVFLPMLIEFARNGQSAETEQLSQFLELLAINEDVRLQEVVSVTVLEFLEGEPDAIGVLRPQFGPGTLRLLEERERWRRAHR
jgi:hypothetical protein